MQPAKHKGHKELIYLAGREGHRGSLRFDSSSFSLEVFKDRLERSWSNLASCPWQGFWKEMNFNISGSVI